MNTLPRTPYALIGLAMAAFAIGTSEFVIMGLLPEVAADLSVSIPQAGLLVTGYALGVVIGAPILAIITAKLPRRETKPQKRRTQHRGITETSGHKTDAMLDLYGHEVAVVEPARAGESERVL